MRNVMSIGIGTFLQVIGILASVGWVYTILVARITRVETKVDHIENTAEKAMAQLNGKLDKITEELSDVRIMLENKANRQ